MSKKFRCGRLLQTKDGRMKKLDLGHGGGTRTCDWTDDNMTFDEVHHLLLAVYSLTDQKHQTKLFDFQHQPLDVKKFPTFTDYMKQYGLNKNSTVVYLCTSEASEEVSQRPEVKKKSESVQVIEHPLQSSSEYSFTDTSLDLMKNIRELINKNPSNKTLAQLFENLCLIHGHVFSIILPLQQLNEHSNESERILYSHNLHNVYDIFESTKALLHRSRDRFRHTQLFSAIQMAFLEFHSQVQTLRDRWTQTERTSENMDTIVPPINGAVTETITSSKPSSRKENKKQSQDRMKLFKAPLNILTYLSRITKPRGLPSFDKFILRTIQKVKTIRNRLDFSDQASIDHAKRDVLAIKNQLVKHQRDIRTETNDSRSDRTFHRTHAKSVKVIRSLLSSLYSKQVKIVQKRQAITKKS